MSINKHKIMVIMRFIKLVVHFFQTQKTESIWDHFQIVMMPCGRPKSTTPNLMDAITAQENVTQVRYL